MAIGRFQTIMSNPGRFAQWFTQLRTSKEQRRGRGAAGTATGLIIVRLGPARRRGLRLTTKRIAGLEPNYRRWLEGYARRVCAAAFRWAAIPDPVSGRCDERSSPDG